MTVIRVYKFEIVEWENTSEKRILRAWQKVILINLRHYISAP